MSSAAHEDTSSLAEHRDPWRWCHSLDVPPHDQTSLNRVSSSLGGNWIWITCSSVGPCAKGILSVWSVDLKKDPIHQSNKMEKTSHRRVALRRNTGVDNLPRCIELRETSAGLTCRGVWGVLVEVWDGWAILEGRNEWQEWIEGWAVLAVPRLSYWHIYCSCLLEDYWKKTIYFVFLLEDDKFENEKNMIK